MFRILAAAAVAIPRLEKGIHNFLAVDRGHSRASMEVGQQRQASCRMWIPFNCPLFVMHTFCSSLSLLDNGRSRR